MIKVCKFGGTSMADGIDIGRAGEIVARDPTRKYIVVSAPGKRYGGDEKVTDLLYAAHRELIGGGHVRDSYFKVASRFRSIVRELKLDLAIDALLEETKRSIEERASEAFTVSRGEYLTGKIFASLLRRPFVDAADCVLFSGGRLNAAATYEAIGRSVGESAVVAGFYGADEEGNIVTFSRGGSDISGALVARAVHADLYENWTDVSGFLACDPRIVPSPEGISALSYRELRALSYMGANVLHSESVFPVREAGIPIVVRNVFRPEDRGTTIFPDEGYENAGRTVTGIAGKKGFCVLTLEKSLMNAEKSFAFDALDLFRRYHVPCEHIPSDVDAMSFLIAEDCLKGGVLETLKEELDRTVHPDRISFYSGIALIAVVGQGMRRNVEAAARIFRAIARAGVNVRMIDRGASELSITVGVDNDDCERTVRAVYEEFFTT